MTIDIERLKEWATTDCGIRNIEHRGGYEHAQFDVMRLIDAEYERQKNHMLMEKQRGSEGK